MRRDEMCPKCHSAEVGVLSFNREEANYRCKKCRHEWVGPRKMFGRMVDSLPRTLYYVTCQECSHRIISPLRCLTIGGKHYRMKSYSEARFFVCPRCDQVYYHEEDFIAKRFFERKRAHKFEATSLKELCEKLNESKDDEMLVRPYLRKIVRKGENDFGMIVECEHATYEVGLSENFLDDPMHRLFRRWIGPHKGYGFDFDVIKRKIRRLENFARGLSSYFREKGYPAISLEIQHLDREPKRTVGDEDSRIFLHILAQI